MLHDGREPPAIVQTQGAPGPAGIANDDGPPHVVLNPKKLLERAVLGCDSARRGPARPLADDLIEILVDGISTGGLDDQERHHGYGQNRKEGC